MMLVLLMDNLAWVVPLVVLLAKVLFRLVANNELELADIEETLLVLPVDIIFLAISFASAKAISAPDHQTALSWALAAGGLLILGVGVVALWRCSQRAWDKAKKAKVTVVVISNWLISLVPLLLVIRGLQ